MPIPPGEHGRPAWPLDVRPHHLADAPGDLVRRPDQILTPTLVAGLVTASGAACVMTSGHAAPRGVPQTSLVLPVGNGLRTTRDLPPATRRDADQQARQGGDGVTGLMGGQVRHRTYGWWGDRSHGFADLCLFAWKDGSGQRACSWAGSVTTG